ncbi:MAG: hypothetical protein Q7S19_02160 [bacterium]|nr:hypothetical protein [bacterium]
MPDNAKIKKLIEDSFITPDQKRALTQYIDLKGVDMKLFDTFNGYLVEATKDKGKKYKQTVKKIDEAQAELDKRITEEKSEIEKNLEQELDGLDPQDKKTKDRIWKEYYETLDELGERYGKGLKDILSKILTSVA